VFLFLFQFKSVDQHQQEVKLIKLKNIQYSCCFSHLNIKSANNFDDVLVVI
jgi:hypothetical protein